MNGREQNQIVNGAGPYSTRHYAIGYGACVCGGPDPCSQSFIIEERAQERELLESLSDHKQEIAWLRKALQRIVGGEYWSNDPDLDYQEIAQKALETK